MKIKKLFSAVLMLFILFSISLLVYKELLQKSYSKGNTVTEVQNNKESQNYAASPQKQSAQDKKVNTRDKVTTKLVEPEAACNFQGASCDSNNKVIAYYFHGTNRCTTCRTIERYSKEAIDRYFAQELKNGKLDFKPINVDEPENRHYIQDYQLYTRSLVLALYKDDKQLKWKNLSEVWSYVRDQEKFYQYVKDETERFLQETE
ncbi:MAG: nitrophenyl compound nitroreductase subunit ArsF family protein [Nitrospirota bacterium]